MVDEGAPGSLLDDEALPAASRSMRVARRRDGVRETAAVELPEEAAVALEFNGITAAVMLCTPTDLEDFAYGFALTEGIVDAPAAIRAIDPSVSERGITLEISLASESFARLKERRRMMAGRTGCGLCGVDSLEQAIRPLPPLYGRGRTIAAAAIRRAGEALRGRQPLQQATGATHAAAWCTADGSIALVREDVGRHNALDKLVGALARAGTDTAAGFALVTSRASLEMVQKAAFARIPVLAAVSAPTATAVRAAQECGLTLLGFARGDEHTLYAHPERIPA